MEFLDSHWMGNLDHSFLSHFNSILDNLLLCNSYGSSIYLSPTFKENGAWCLDPILQILAVVKDVQNEKKKKKQLSMVKIFHFLFKSHFSLTEIIKLAILYKVTKSKLENSNVLHHF
jgi:hypothetical protein